MVGTEETDSSIAAGVRGIVARVDGMVVAGKTGGCVAGGCAGRMGIAPDA